MGTEQAHLLGEDFAAISAGVCGIKSLTAKLILYAALEDGYGKYFHSIFSPRDRQDPYLVQELGSPTPMRLSAASRKCAVMAEEFIAAHGLEVSQWTHTWKDIALSGEVRTVLRRYRRGELGQRFLHNCGITGSFIDLLVAKRALMDVLADRESEEKIFTHDELSSFLFQSLRGSDEWRSCGICSDKFLADVREKALEFAASELGLFREGAPFVGVTFGWPAKDRKEWHLFGNLTSANIFRGELGDLPGLFGLACYGVEPEVLEPLYSSTYVCVVAVDAATRVAPDCINGAYMYNYPLADIVSCKWVGTLPEVLGPYLRTKGAIQVNYKQMRKECSRDANAR